MHFSMQSRQVSNAPLRAKKAKKDSHKATPGAATSFLESKTFVVPKLFLGPIRLHIEAILDVKISESILDPKAVTNFHTECPCVLNEVTFYLRNWGSYPEAICQPCSLWGQVGSQNWLQKCLQLNQKRQTAGRSEGAHAISLQDDQSVLFYTELPLLWWQRPPLLKGGSPTRWPLRPITVLLAHQRPYEELQEWSEYLVSRWWDSLWRPKDCSWRPNQNLGGLKSSWFVSQFWKMWDFHHTWGWQRGDPKWHPESFGEHSGRHAKNQDGQQE